MGIEPTYQAWKASVLPLNYARTRQYFIISKNKPFTKLSDENAPWPLREKRPPCGSLCFIIAKYKEKMGPFYEKSAGLKFRQKRGRPCPLQEAYPKTGDGGTPILVV